MANTTILQTERLRLSTFAETDLSDLVGLHRDPSVNRYLASHEIIHTSADAERHLADYITGQERRGFTQWKATLGDGSFVGRAGFSVYRETSEVALSVCLGAAHWGKGYASELASALVDWYFRNTYYTHLIAFVAAGNTPARRMMEGIGFKQRQRTVIEDGAVDCLQILSPSLAKRFLSA
ncbi:GNAT family N-acetyltransferase [Stappia sp.]|jgi:RimJ/RimL family protein N-acetyltransferase|uniref:GNAT family N-acetyltransferase n=1 Tax=Stappia sp. TaxID=1870903 RepID=UPI003A98CF7F